MPDVPTILNCIPHNHTCFTVIDLCSAFFSIPVHAETQPLFAFTFKGMQLTWTRLAQGFVDSPAVFSAAVKHVLNAVIYLPSTVCVLNYTDDILFIIFFYHIIFIVANCIFTFYITPPTSNPPLVHNNKK